MINYSKPKFVSVEDVLSLQKDDNKTTAVCRCPLPIAVEIDGVEGGYCHVVEYEKKYICEDCGTEFSIGRACWTKNLKTEA